MHKHFPSDVWLILRRLYGLVRISASTDTDFANTTSDFLGDDYSVLNEWRDFIRDWQWYWRDWIGRFGHISDTSHKWVNYDTH